MTVYKYTAQDTTGHQLSGTYANVRSVGALREELGKLGYALVDAKRERTATRAVGRIRQREVAAFAYKFGGMYSAGLPVLRCLETLEAQTANRALRDIVADVRYRVETGSSLKSAFEPHRKVFTDFFLLNFIS